MSKLRVMIALQLFILCFFAPPATADEIAACRIPASENQTVSLGFPLRQERLAKVDRPKILVVPFKLRDNPKYVFNDEMKNLYLSSAKDVSLLSNRLSNIEFIFARTISTPLTSDDMEELKVNQREQWQRDEAKSTYGFVRKFISDYDSELDFTNISAVVLEGSSTSLYSDMGEAFMFWENPQNPWFRPIQTSEGPINNVILFDNTTTQQIITHEILHLYGLTDLYGKRESPSLFSLMSSDLARVNLLNYEKWILGWLPESQIQCISVLSQSGFTKVQFDLNKGNQIAIIRGNNGEDYVVEATSLYNKRHLIFYSLQNEARPPITLLGDSGIENPSVIGKQFRSSNFDVMISDLEANSVSLELIPQSLRVSTEFEALIAKNAETKRQREQQYATQIAKQTSSKSPSSDRAKSVTCVKGNQTKKVSGLDPKCPKGYKKR